MKQETTKSQLGPDEQARAAAVRDMFTAIAPRYDFLNHLLSFYVDKLWWWRAARTFAHVLSRPDAAVLDLCCGTGDMSFALLRRARYSRRNRPRTEQSGDATPVIFGVDFSHAMLVRAIQKAVAPSSDDGATSVRWIEADALQLPFADASLALVTSAFGFRNLANYDAGLREIYRVLSPGGELGILDFGEPRGVIGKVYGIYFRHVLPAVGTLISGVRGPYAYLTASVRRFPAPDEMLDRLRAVGFHNVSWRPYTFGIAGLYRAAK